MAFYQLHIFFAEHPQPRQHPAHPSLTPMRSPGRMDRSICLQKMYCKGPLRLSR